MTPKASGTQQNTVLHLQFIAEGVPVYTSNVLKTEGNERNTTENACNRILVYSAENNGQVDTVDRQFYPSAGSTKGIFLPERD